MREEVANKINLPESRVQVRKMHVKLLGYDLFMLSVYLFIYLFIYFCCLFSPVPSPTFRQVCYRDGGVPVLEEQQQP